jgi:hypothetical protein
VRLPVTETVNASPSPAVWKGRGVSYIVNREERASSDVRGRLEFVDVAGKLSATVAGMVVDDRGKRLTGKREAHQ